MGGRMEVSYSGSAFFTLKNQNLVSGREPLPLEQVTGEYGLGEPGGATVPEVRAIPGP